MSELQQAYVEMVSWENELRKQKRIDGQQAAIKRVWGRKLDRFRHLASLETDTEAATRKLEGLT